MNRKEIICVGCLLLIFYTVSGQTFPDTMANMNDKQAVLTGPEISFGMEIRERVRIFNNINFGDVSDPKNKNDAYLNQRYYFNADLRLSKVLGLHAQLGSSYTSGKNNVTTSDQDVLYMGEAYLDINIQSPYMHFLLGRQEFSFGSGRILGVSDGPNVNQSLNGFRYSIDLRRFSGNFFIACPGEYRKGIFNNSINTDNLMVGSYFTAKFPEDLELDLYFFGNKLKDAQLESLTGDEQRYTFGGRLSKTEGTFQHSFEAAWQTGSFGNRQINAFLLAGSAGYYWQNTRLKPKVELKGAVYSGDRDTTDNTLNLFRPLYSKSPVNNAVSIGPSNIIVFAPETQIQTFKQAVLIVSYYAVWRYASTDGIYSTRVDNRTREPDKNGIEKGLYITNGFKMGFEYAVNRHLEVNLTTAYFKAGEYLRNTGNGKNVTTLFFTALYQF